MTPFRIGTRGSRLALAQSHWVRDELRRAHPDLKFELVEIRTTGDRIRDVPLLPEHGSSFFTKEIEDALIAGRIDVAVHSCKDLATRLPEGLILAAFPPRGDARDVLVSRLGALQDLPHGASVGTSSMRRQGFVSLARPDLEVLPVRGNVPTRVAAVDEGRMTAVVLAAAGLIRLGLDHRITSFIDPEQMLPAAGQGALALEVRSDDQRAVDLVTVLDDTHTRAAVECERSCLRTLEAGCQSPVGAWARMTDAGVTLDARIVAPDRDIRASGSAPISDAEVLGERTARTILAQLGVDSLSDVDWAGPPPASKDGRP